LHCSKSSSLIPIKALTISYTLSQQTLPCFSQWICFPLLSCLSSSSTSKEKERRRREHAFPEEQWREEQELALAIGTFLLTKGERMLKTKKCTVSLIIIKKHWLLMQLVLPY